MMKNTVPSKMSSTRFNQPWINKEVKKVSRLKKKYFIKARNSQLPEDRNKYQEIKKLARKTCKKAYREYIHNIISPDCTSNPKKFWGFINSKKCDSSGVAPLKGTDGFTYSDAKAKANILNSQFSSVFNTNEPSDNIKELEGTFNEMSQIKVTHNGVLKMLRNLKIHKAT